MLDALEQEAMDGDEDSDVEMGEASPAPIVTTSKSPKKEKKDKRDKGEEINGHKKDKKHKKDKEHAKEKEKDKKRKADAMEADNDEDAAEAERAARKAAKKAKKAQALADAAQGKDEVRLWFPPDELQLISRMYFPERITQIKEIAGRRWRTRAQKEAEE